MSRGQALTNPLIFENFLITWGELWSRECSLYSIMCYYQIKMFHPNIGFIESVTLYCPVAS